MALKKIKISLFFIIAIFLVLGLSVSFQSLLAAWTAPAANPPTCATGNAGCDAPLNAGPLIQLKSGALWLNTNGLSPYGLIVENGNVGIGATGPWTDLVVGKTSGIPQLDLGKNNQNFMSLRYDISTGVSYIYSYLNNAVSNLALLPGGGYVGIGTTAPHGKLDVAGNSHLLGSGGRKIYGHSDPNNYYIGSYPVAGSDGLDIHWHGGVRLGDSTGSVL